MFKITKYKNLTFVSNTVKSGYGTGASLGNIAIFQFHDVVPTNAFGHTVICKLPVAPILSFECTATILDSNGKSERVSVDEMGNVKIIGSGTITPNIPYTFSFAFPFKI